MNFLRNLPLLASVVVVLSLSGCGTTAPTREPMREPQAERPARVAKVPAPAPSPAPRTTRGGGYYLDDGPGASPPPDLDSIPEPVPRLEPLHRATMRPYIVMGQTFTPMTELTAYRSRGVATWYGRRYHGKQTSSGEVYDMYAISAAHPTLPIPSYARVTNVTTGKSVVVRVNDRGPFLDNRLIDLSYTAAHRIGVLAGGSALVEVESIIPDGSFSGTAIAVAPPSRGAPSRPPVVAAVRPPAAAPSPYAGDADPILALANAARSVDPGLAPASEAPASAPPAREPTRNPADPAGVYLQLGAFGSRENAESYLARAKVQVEWLAERLHVLSREGLFRVHAGPYASAGEAREAAERVALSLGVKPVVVTR